MANLPTGQISNHYELKDWDLFQIPEKEVADKWDGHTPQEAAERLHKYLLEKQDEQKPVIEGTFVNVDKVREDFMKEVYRVLDADPTNDSANQIIDAFDQLPTIIIQKPTEWSEKDERMFDRLRKHFDWGNGYYFNRNDCDEADDWLISLKERIKGE